LAVTQELGSDGSRTLSISRVANGALKLQLVIWNDATTFPNSSVKSLAAIDCVGTRADCGAYERPVEVTVRGKSDALDPGTDTTIKGDRPKSTRMLIGPARDVAWNAPSCQGIEARAGKTASLLELRTY